MITNREAAMERLNQLVRECDDDNFPLWLVEKLAKMEWKVEAMREGLLLIGSGAEASVRLVDEKPQLGSGQLEGISIIAKEVLEATKD
jgi:hypothetical protein